MEGTIWSAYCADSAAVTAWEPRFAVAMSPSETTAVPSSAHSATFDIVPRPMPRTPHTKRGWKPERTRGMYRMRACTAMPAVVVPAMRVMRLAFQTAGS